MKPAPFKYFAPTSVHECLDLLRQYGDEAKLLAGGQSLVPLMNFRLVQPSVIIDLNRVSELNYVRYDNAKALYVGAMTRQRTLELDPKLREANPLLVEAASYIGHFQIRNRGTVGGSVAHADPAGELPAVLLALEGSIKVIGHRGDRVIAASQFFRGPLMTDLAPDEVLAEIQLPAWEKRAGWAVLEIARRHGDFALVGVACWLTTDSEGVITRCSAALFGVSTTPVLVSASPLIGTRASEADIARVAEFIADELKPNSDIHASREYRKHLARVLVKRGFALAYERAQGGTQ